MPAAYQETLCPHCRRQTATINGVCSNCGRLKREEDLDDESWVSGRSSLDFRSDALGLGFAALVTSPFSSG